jgi:homopolymeric O-antigen transport system permease protein
LAEASSTSGAALEPPAPLASADARRLRDLVLHLAARDISSAHRFTLFGWAWPLVRQLVQLAVLVFIFKKVVIIDVDHYPVFVFCGLIAWTWFSAGVLTAAHSLQGSRHLVFRPRFPAVVIPAVAVVVPLVDVFMAFPVLIVMLALSAGLSATILFMPVLLVIQVVLMLGVAWLIAAAAVFLRDVQSLTAVGLTILFYLTPVFYDPPQAGRFEWVLRINPMTTLVDAYRAVLLRGEAPDALAVTALAAGSVAIALIGWFFFRRLEPRFVDEL